MNDLEDLRDIITWWHLRKTLASKGATQRRRITYHLAPRWIDVIREEAEKTGETQGDILDRALQFYFGDSINIAHRILMEKAETLHKS